MLSLILSLVKKWGFAYLFLFTFSGFQNGVSEITIEIIAIVYKRLMLGHVKHELSQAVMKQHVNSDLQTE